MDGPALSPPPAADKDIGAWMHALAAELYPICRSLTGAGVRRTLGRVAAEIPLTLHEVPSGTPVLDWAVPKEWTIRGARIETLDGRRLVDLRDHALHVLNYSGPVDAVVSRADLAAHVHTLPQQPDLIPYRTAYYAETWGFCLPHRLWEEMTDPEYRVVIDSTLAPGHLTYGELHIPGETGDDILLSVHVCHPQLANDNLSGLAVATALVKRVLETPGRRLGLRLLLLPATIGAITWLARNAEAAARIRHGLTLSCVGDPGPVHYKHSRRETADIDRAMAHLLRHAGVEHGLLPFSPYGYDERQYCSPGYDLPVGCFMRGVHGTFPEYHTSADNLDFITPAALDQSYRLLAQLLDLLDADVTYVRRDGRGEPQLGRRGLYRQIAGQKEQGRSGGGLDQMAVLWVLNLADGRHSLLDMAERAGLPFATLKAAADACLAADLIIPAGTAG
ncbi:DUF4910 domain-containing protein [Oleisolibacter albus]|uniref:DUF4910 domain-containing protein n=1 Tax=Oleisolibacter albus TaxID=2171757 RepID=UPI001EFEA929|nr:DUF4910 domain-containing protein [Oleisolibacter albus]